MIRHIQVVPKCSSLVTNVNVDGAQAAHVDVDKTLRNFHIELEERAMDINCIVNEYTSVI